MSCLTVLGGIFGIIFVVIMFSCISANAGQSGADSAVLDDEPIRSREYNRNCIINGGGREQFDAALKRYLRVPEIVYDDSWIEGNNIDAFIRTKDGRYYASAHIEANCNITLSWVFER